MSARLKNELLPVYLVVGDDKLKAKTVLERLDKRMAEYGDMSLNSSSFDGESAIGTDIVTACNQLPFASEKRYVLVRNADKLKKDDSERIVDYLADPNTSTVLVMICTKLAKSTRLYKACEKISNTAVISCASPKRYELADDLVKVARSHNGSIRLDAAQRLIELVGPETIQLNAEIEKLLLANGGSEITVEQVNSQVTKSAEIKPWDFTNAFAARDLDMCLRFFTEMSNGAEYMLLPQTCKIIKELICVQDLGENTTQNEISQELGYEAWRVKNHYA